MDSLDVGTEQIDNRRAFLRNLQGRDDVVNTDFSRDGLQEMYIEFGDGVGFHRSLQERAHGLGYRIEHCCGGVYHLIIED